jgi:Fe-S-cluster containining protein
MTYVPCNGCVACCKSQRIILDPTEDRQAYVVEPTRKGNDGPTEFMLAHKPNGDCWYLEGEGCSIHDRAPKACREFDCRKWFSAFTITEQAHVIKSSLDRACAEAAIARMEWP